MEDKIKISVINRLPAGCHILRIEETENMDGIQVKAILTMWSDMGMIRKAHFNLETGEYLGESF